MKRKISLVGSAFILTHTAVFANGFYVPVQAPEATARGNAWLATANTAAAVYYNAAGLTQLDHNEITVGAYGISLGLEADLDSGQQVKADNGWAVLPQIYGAIPLTDKLVIGYGLNTPFGLATDWGQTSQFRYIATETKLNYATGWLVAGYEITDTFSIGGGLGVHYADLKIGQVTNLGGKDFASEFRGSDEAITYTLSAMWKPCLQHSFGLTYRSQADFDLDGDFQVKGVLSEQAQLDFITPSTLGGGYSFRPNENWNIEANIEWVNWDELNSLKLSKASGNNTIPFNWKSNFIYSVGATRYFENGWNVSAGYNFIENSMPDNTFTPGVADANRHWLNAGVGRDYGKFKWNFAYQYAFSNNEVSGSQAGLADGDFESSFHGLMMNCGWKF